MLFNTVAPLVHAQKAQLFDWLMNFCYGVDASFGFAGRSKAIVKIRIFHDSTIAIVGNNTT
jgi:hypothetical protein